ncbi:MAG TPA: hypothetical protein VKG63_14485 [Steroidobacteraceae bacterium]|nr:hypothetical protein [Steroidobacteraceae bacterium]
MIVTPRFVFLHLHKSGGTFINECLLKFVPDAQHVGYHLPRRMVPEQNAHLPALGSVRNPWSYYVSWYSFQLERPNPNFLFRILSDDGRLDFETTVHNMLDLGAGSVRLDMLLRALPSAYSNQGLNLPNFALEPIRNTQLGFYTYLYRYMYQGGRVPVTVSRMEDLRSDLVPMLEQVRQPVSEEMRAFIENEMPRNPSQHRGYAEYYSDALRDLVAKRDAEIIERHGYRFGD